MKHFIVEIKYIAPIEKIEETTLEHREYLQQGYAKGILLMSGPQVPRTGGIIIAKENSKEEIERFFKDDPYQKKNLAEYRIVEFLPKNRQEFLNGWIEE